jgi:NAD(P)-dependent dehydrogenase (short-subunit alcohol dehydrogenase family)
MARESYDVNGKVAFVTGAARGIGLESARRLHARGASVALVGLEPEELERRAAELGARAAAFHADVTDWDELRAAVDGTVERFGGIDVAIANAGVANVGTVQSMDVDDFERVVEVNLLGVWRTVRTTLPHVVERRGYALNIASLAAVVHSPLMAPYTATKAAVEAFTDALRVELAGTGARAGTAYFGFIDTDMVRDAFEHPASSITRKSGPSFIADPIPLAKAGDAIERAVLERRRITYAPRWVGTAIALRGVLQPLLERGMMRRDDIKEAVRVAREAEQSEVPPPGTHTAARGGSRAKPTTPA